MKSVAGLLLFGVIALAQDNTRVLDATPVRVEEGVVTSVQLKAPVDLP